jgi:dUTP pyrophosphatase
MILKMIQYKLIHPNAKFGAENKKTSGSAGYDLYTVEDVIVPFGGDVKAHTGVCLDMSEERIQLPDNYKIFGQLVARSSLHHAYSVVMPNGVGIIDNDYQGELLVPLIYIHHVPGEFQRIPAGTAIAQIVFTICIVPTFKQVSTFSLPTERGDGGFGSTDIANDKNYNPYTYHWWDGFCAGMIPRGLNFPMG